MLIGVVEKGQEKARDSENMKDESWVVKVTIFSFQRRPGSEA